MPDPIVAADAQPAGSSPASTYIPTNENTDGYRNTPAATPSSGVDLDTLSATELATWRSTGDLPGTSPVTDAPAASSTAPAVEDPPVSTETPAQAASEPADLKAKTKARIEEVLAGQARERDRADRAERRLQELERRPAQPPPDARPAASSAAPAGSIAPDPETFQWGTADPEYLKALTAHTVAETLAVERRSWEEGQRQARAKSESDRVLAAFEEKAAASRVLHPDFDDIAMKATTDIPPGSLADLFVLENKPDAYGVGGAEILYFLQQPQNRAEQTRLLALPTMDQMIALVRLGDRLKVGAPATSTSVPAPPPVLSTRATPTDPVARAIRDDDTAAYNREMNARDLARLKD